MEDKETNNKECPYFLICPGDNPTKVAGLGWRVAYTIFAWLILGHGITEGNSFFVSLTLFAAPLLMDYLKFRPKSIWRIGIKSLGVLFSSLWVLIGLMGMSGIISIKIMNEKLFFKISEKFIALSGYCFPVIFIWYCISISILLTVLDWITYECNLEKKYIFRRESSQTS